METEVCLGVRLIVPFWCGFRDPTSSNVHRTFPVPPPATLYGLVAAALGLGQDDYSRRDEMRFAVAIERAGEIVESYSKWMKGAESAPKDEGQRQAWDAMRVRKELAPDESVWISTPVIRQKVIQPVFLVGILCTPAVAEHVAMALRRPFFPLCLGESDDPVDVTVVGAETPRPTTGGATGTVTGVWPGGLLASLPTRFHPEGRGKWSLERWLVTVPKPGEPVPASGPHIVACHGQVWMFEPPPGAR